MFCRMEGQDNVFPTSLGGEFLVGRRHVLKIKTFVFYLPYWRVPWPYCGLGTCRLYFEKQPGFGWSIQTEWLRVQMKKGGKSMPGMTRNLIAVYNWQGRAVLMSLDEATGAFMKVHLYVYVTGACTSSALVSLMFPNTSMSIYL